MESSLEKWNLASTDSKIYKNSVVTNWIPSGFSSYFITALFPIPSSMDYCIATLSDAMLLNYPFTPR